MGIIKYSGFYSRALCKANPDKVFVFGDNLVGHGTGGQAIIRHEPNVLGVPTKRSPSMDRSAFFAQGDEDALVAVRRSVVRMTRLLEGGGVLVIPTTDDGRISLGLGLAKLDTKAPDVYGEIVSMIDQLSQEYGERNDTDGSELNSAD
jgi:hypothetical protein